MKRRRSPEDRRAHAWIELQRNWWAHDVLDDDCRDRPSKAWRVLVRLSEMADTAGLVSILGAGPLEDFIRYHAPRFIGDIEKQAALSPRFRKAMRIVWLPRAVDDISRKLFALGCKPINSQVEQWQTAPPQSGRKKRTKASDSLKRDLARRGIILLEPDVAGAFKTAEAANRVLRASLRKNAARRAPNDLTLFVARSRDKWRS